MSAYDLAYSWGLAAYAWIASLGFPPAIILAGYALGPYYKAKVERSVKHPFDIALEELRAELRTKDNQISTLQGSALSAMSSRHIELNKRKIQAVERIWSSVASLGAQKAAAEYTKSLRMDKIISEAAKAGVDGEKMKSFAGLIWQATGLEKYKFNDIAQSERPFVPPLVWALYSTYRQVLGHPTALLAAAKAGLEPALLADPKPLIDLIKAALPDQSKYVDEYQTVAIPYIIQPLEDKLLQSLVDTLNDPEADLKGVEQAAVIQKAANAVAEASVKKEEIKDLSPGMLR